MLCNHTLAYSHQHPVEQAPVAVGVHIDLDGGDEEEEEEDYLPSEEQVLRDLSPDVDFDPNWYQQFNERFSNMENMFGEMEGQLDHLDGNMQTF